MGTFEGGRRIFEGGRRIIGVISDPQTRTRARESPGLSATLGILLPLIPLPACRDHGPPTLLRPQTQLPQFVLLPCFLFAADPLYPLEGTIRPQPCELGTR